MLPLQKIVFGDTLFEGREEVRGVQDLQGLQGLSSVVRGLESRCSLCSRRRSQFFEGRQFEKSSMEVL